MTIKSDIEKLIDSPSISQPLPAEKTAPAIPSSVGFSPIISAEVPGVSSGISSPLTEVSRLTVDVEVFDNFNVWSVIEKHTTQLTMLDNDGRTVIFNFINPLTGTV